MLILLDAQNSKVLYKKSEIFVDLLQNTKVIALCRYSIENIFTNDCRFNEIQDSW